MRRSLAWSLLGLAVCASPALAADPPGATGATAPSTPEYSTQVQGTVPDLAGRWFVVTQVEPPQGGQGVIGVLPGFWEVTTADGKPQLVVRWLRLPPPLARAVETANKEKRGWEPSVRELEQLRDAWSTLPAEDRGAARVEAIITGKDALADAVKADARMKDAEFLVQIDVSYNPGGGRPMRDVLLHAVLEPQPFGYRGNYASVSIAAAPVPIPIALAGTFRLYRLESLPEPGLLRRVLGMFSGCGRTADERRP
jgi:hypothetical protein